MWQLSRGYCPGLHFATYHESVYSCTKRVGLLYDMLKNDEELVLDSGTRLGLDLAWTRLGLDSASVWLGSARTRSLLDSARLGLGVGGLDYSPADLFAAYAPTHPSTHPSPLTFPTQMTRLYCIWFALSLSVSSAD